MKSADDLPPMMSRQAAFRWWEYTRGYEDAFRTFYEHFVPHVMLAADPLTKQVSRVVSWTNGMPQVFPECDYVMVNIITESDEPAATVEFIGVLRYGDLAAALQNDIERGTFCNQEVMLYSPQTILSREELLRLPLQGPQTVTCLRGVRTMEFVDIRIHVIVQPFDGENGLPTEQPS